MKCFFFLIFCSLHLESLCTHLSSRWAEKIKASKFGKRGSCRTCPLSANRTDKWKHCLLPSLAGAARSDECDQWVCLSALSGEICRATWANRTSQLVDKKKEKRKKHFTLADILGTFSGSRLFGTRDGSRFDQNALELNTSSARRSAA